MMRFEGTPPGLRDASVIGAIIVQFIRLSDRAEEEGSVAQTPAREQITDELFREQETAPGILIRHITQQQFL